jgi:type II secretory pathway pseudopilin PulG
MSDFLRHRAIMTHTLETHMLDIHPPHEAAHTWKDFFIHIATIVIGLLIAIGLEQTVEAIHHHREVSETREALRAEIGDNRKAFEQEARIWHWETTELQNNLDTLEYLRQHPGTPDEKLPGVLFWSHRGAHFSHAAWDAATSAGVTSLLPREEITEMQAYYERLAIIDTAASDVWAAINDASRFEFDVSRLSALTPAQIEEITKLTEIAMERHFLWGIALENAGSRQSKEFPPSITTADLGLHKMQFVPKAGLEAGNPAYALTVQRLEAAGYPSASPTSPSPKAPKQ